MTDPPPLTSQGGTWVTRHLACLSLTPMRFPTIPGAIALRGQRIGLLGGSFNPAHAGHVHVSEIALRRLGLDAVWWLVSPQNPLKSVGTMAPLADRLGAAQALLSGHRRIRATALESDLGTRFTVDTIAKLRRAAPGIAFVWLIGADNMVQIPHWRRWTDLFKLVPLAVFSRETYDLKALAGPASSRFRTYRCPVGAAARLATMPPPAWTFLPIRHHPASASAIRAGHQFGGNGSPPSNGR